MSWNKKKQQKYLEELKSRGIMRLKDIGIYKGPADNIVKVDDKKSNTRKEGSKVKTEVDIMMKDLKTYFDEKDNTKDLNKNNSQSGMSKKNLNRTEDDEILALLKEIDDQTDSLLSNINEDGEVSATDMPSPDDDETDFIKQKNIYMEDDDEMMNMSEAEDEMNDNDDDEDDISKKVNELFDLEFDIDDAAFNLFNEEDDDMAEEDQEEADEGESPEEEQGESEEEEDQEEADEDESMEEPSEEVPEEDEIPEEEEIPEEDEEPVLSSIENRINRMLNEIDEEMEIQDIMSYDEESDMPEEDEDESMEEPSEEDEEKMSLEEDSDVRLNEIFKEIDSLYEESGDIRADSEDVII